MKYFAFILLFSAAPAFALDLHPDEADLALALAKITANERSLSHARPADMALIYQAMRRHGETPRERLRWLQRHSDCVFGEVAPEARTEPPPPGSNCWWSWHLKDSDEEPKNFGRWQTVEWENYAPRWRAMRSYAKRIVAGYVPQGGWPCPRDPDTWGGHVDRARARRLGYVPMRCRGTANEGYRYPPVHSHLERSPTNGRGMEARTLQAGKLHAEGPVARHREADHRGGEGRRSSHHQRAGSRARYPRHRQQAG